MQQELTISASAFKARCLDLMDQLASHKLTRITVTKRGKPVSVVQPPPPSPAKQSIVGCMAHKIPQLTDEEWIEVEREVAALSAAWPSEEEMTARITAGLRDAA